MNPEDTGRGSGSGETKESGSESPTRTPFYLATRAARYQRQEAIQRIQERTGRRLLCYVSDIRASIDRDHTIGFVDLLHNVAAGADVDLLIHTGGGDVDAAEKLITMVQKMCGQGGLRSIVPDYAKSAGTLMTLGTDTVVMSDSSELGPIDPQIVLRDANGNIIQSSVQAHLDAFADLQERLRKDPNDVAAHVLFAKLDPATIKLFEGTKERARQSAERQLKTGMFRKASGNGNFTKIAGELIDTKRWLSHGQMIDREDAQQLGLHVTPMSPKDPEWLSFWHLYCLQRLEVKAGQTLFESDYASLILDGPAV